MYFPFPDDKILAMSRLTGFADNKYNFTQNIKFVFHLLGNNVGEGENASYQHFSLFSQYMYIVFQKAISMKDIYCLE